MRRIVVDASALAALVFQEPEAAEIGARLHGAELHAPVLLKFELANTAWKKIRQRPSDTAQIIRALNKALDPKRSIFWHQVDHADAVLTAHAIGLSTYDASYLWLAGFLGAELVTLDKRFARSAREHDD